MSQYCSNCGVEINEGASFCGACGSKVIIPTTNSTRDSSIKENLQNKTQTQEL